MAFTAISNALVAVGAKPFATTMQALRDNLPAAFGGATGAPRLVLGALERLVAGTVIRSRNDAGASQGASQPGAMAHSFSFVQSGSVRLTGTSQGSANLFITRTRNGASTTLATYTGASTARSLDVDVLAGDTVAFTLGATGGASSNSWTLCRFQTDGGALWPGSEARLEN